MRSTSKHTDPESYLGLVRGLEEKFSHIATTRMQNVPIQNLKLHVQAIGFAPMSPTNESIDVLLGVLITPWFMNLVRLPMGIVKSKHLQNLTGSIDTHEIGDQSFDFITAFDDDIGLYETCSLFSPMFEFEDQGAAIATAQSVLDLLRNSVQEAPTASSRRDFLFGRHCPPSVSVG